MTLYNGWSNRATWNTSLWMNNQYGLYRTMHRIYSKSNNEGAFADDIEYYLNLVWNGVTPDGVNLNPVNWAEIAESWFYENAK